MNKQLFKKNIRKIRKTLRTAPFELLKRPTLLVLLPFAVIDALMDRMRKETTVLYLTETDISEIVNGHNIKEDGCSITIAHTFQAFCNYAQLRLQEDREVDEYYEYDVKMRFARGDFSFIYLDENGTPVSFLFICTGIAHFAPVDMILDLPHSAFGIYDVYTFKVYRGKGFYKRLFCSAVKEMKARGYNKIWLWLMAHNQASVNVHHELGLDNIIKILTHELSFGFVRKRIECVSKSMVDLLV